MESMKRPVGLTIFAVINFIFSGLTLFGMMLLLVPAVQEVMTLSPYSVVSPVVTSLLLLLSGIGFLKLKWGLGYILGNVVGVGTLLNIVVYNALSGFAGFALHIPSMVYPTLLLLFLNLKYKGYFKKSTP